MSTSSSRSLCGLPDELKLNITELIYKSSPHKNPYDVSSGDILIPLSCTSRGWRHMTLPYVYREINLLDKTNEAINRFFRIVASKYDYGRYCRSFGICLHPSPNSDLINSYEIDMIREGPSARRTSWHVERNALCFAITHFMPNLEKVTIAFNNCPWHEYFGSPCGCLDSYDPLVDHLAKRALKFIAIDFGCASSDENGSVDLARKLLAGPQETVEHLYIIHDPDAGGDFTVVDILDLLKDLPSLRELWLMSVCFFADLSDLHWTSPVQTLYVHPDDQGSDDEEDTAYNDDVSLAFESLPHTLRHLHLGRWEYTESFHPLPNAFPSNLALLESLSLRFPVTRAVLAYFQASKLHTLRLRSHFDFPALSRVLDDNTVFTCLQTLYVSYPTGSGNADMSANETAKELLSNACKSRDVTINFGR